MTLLLDTNAVLWFLAEDARLNTSVMQSIRQAPQVHVSTISIWEMEIKRAKGTLRIVPDYVDYIIRCGFIELKASFAHALRVETLPPIHKDPFDRMLVAQALCENLTIVTGDRHIPHYGAKVIAI